MRKWLLAFAALIFLYVCLLWLCCGTFGRYDDFGLAYGKGLDGAWRALRAGNIL